MRSKPLTPTPDDLREFLSYLDQDDLKRLIGLMRRWRSYRSLVRAVGPGGRLIERGRRDGGFHGTQYALGGLAVARLSPASVLCVAPFNPGEPIIQVSPGGVSPVIATALETLKGDDDRHV